MMCFGSAAVAAVNLDNVKRYPNTVVNLEGCPRSGTIHLPALRLNGQITVCNTQLELAGSPNGTMAHFYSSNPSLAT